MNKLEFEKIHGSSTYNNEQLINIIKKYEIEILQVYDKNPTINWDSSTVASLCNEIKDALIALQTPHEQIKVRCAYCRKDFSKNSMQIEHILHKSKYIHLMFSPFNLILACPVCNNPSTKGNIDLISNQHITSPVMILSLSKKREESNKDFARRYREKYNQYKSCNQGFDLIKNITDIETVKELNDDILWIHPYYDSYFDCIEITISSNGSYIYQIKPSANDIQKRKAKSMLDTIDAEWENEQIRFKNALTLINSNASSLEELGE